MTVDWYDRQGKPIDSIKEWEKLFHNFKYRMIAKTDVAGKQVSTVWLGLDHQWGTGPPLIFETMVFPGEGPSLEEYMERYSTEEEARAGHLRVVKMIEDGEI